MMPRQAVAGLAVEAGLAQKAEALDRRLVGLGSVVVAYSGGIDSALLAAVAHRALGPRVLAVTGESPSYPAHHRSLATLVAAHVGFAHEFMATDELSRPAYRANPVDRCYHCKRELYEKLTALASARGFAAVADGTNADDRADVRPGRVAARECQVVSPLDEAGFTKDEIRELARALGLPTWDEPASACLSSRVPHGTAIDPAVLARIDAAETVLRELGFRICRVRHHGELARLEFGRDEIDRATASPVRETIDRRLKKLGYAYVTVDLRGYRLGGRDHPILLRPV
jgi:pyridinium-3,5-biscarboxylic acid mononucleotide sulfurtransferase